MNWPGKVVTYVRRAFLYVRQRLVNIMSFWDVKTPYFTSSYSSQLGFDRSHGGQRVASAHGIHALTRALEAKEVFSYLRTWYKTRRYFKPVKYGVLPSLKDRKRPCANRSYVTVRKLWTIVRKFLSHPNHKRPEILSNRIIIRPNLDLLRLMALR